MAEYTIFGATGPGSTYSVGAFNAAVEFSVTSECTAVAIRFNRSNVNITGTVTGRLYAVTGPTTGTVVAGTAVTFGVLSGTGWHRANMSAAVPLTPGQRYKVVCEFPANIPATSNYWSSGAGAAGITSGPLTAYSAATATNGIQASYGVGATPAYPYQSAGAGPNPWVDVVVVPSVTGAAAIKSGTVVGASAAFTSYAMSAAVVSGTTVGATANVPGSGQIVSGTVVVANAVRSTPATAAIVSGTRVAGAAEGSTSASIVSGTVVTVVTAQEAVASASIVSGTVVTGVAGAEVGVDTAIVSGTVVTTTALIDVPAGAAIVSGTVVTVGAPVVAKYAAATIVSGTTVTAAAFVQSQNTISIVSGTVVTATATVFTPAFRVPDGPAVPQTLVPRLRLLVVDTITGRLHFELPFTSLSWNSPLNGIGALSASLPIESALEDVYAQGASDPRAALREVLLGPYRWSLVVAYGSVAVFGGPYLPSDDAADGTIKVGAKGMERLLERRVLVSTDPANTTNLSDASRDVTFTDSTPAGAIYRIVDQAITTYDGAVPSRALPLVCSQVPALLGDETFTYLAYDVKPAWTAISDIAGRDDGPDVRLEPILLDGGDGTYVNWDLQIGNPYLPASGNIGPEGPMSWTFDDTTSIVTRTTDAVGLSSAWWSTGDGQDREKKIVRSATDTLTRLGFPALEQVDTGSSSQTDLNKLTLTNRAALAAHQTPTDSWSLSVAIDGDPPLGSVRRGELARIDVTRQILIEPGYYPRRITDVSGDATSGRFTLACDEMEVALAETDPIAPSTGVPEPYIPPYVSTPASASKVTNLTGPGLTDIYGVGGTDLGVPVLTANGRLLLIFGDTFTNAGVGGPGWRSPVGLYADPATLRTGLQWTGPATGSIDGSLTRAGQLVPQPHNTVIRGWNISTQLPSDVINLDGTLYMQVIACEGFPNARFMELYQSTNNGNTWTSTGCWWPATQWASLFQSVTFTDGGDGYIYCMGTSFQRDRGLALYRVPRGSFTTAGAWTAWTGSTWSATTTITPATVIPGAFGEASLRQVDGWWVYCAFESLNYRIDARVFADITQVGSAPVKTLLTGVAWANENHSRGLFAQLYGGFIVPGSTIDDLHLIVSQWNTGSGWPYWSVQVHADVTDLVTGQSVGG